MSYPWLCKERGGGGGGNGESWLGYVCQRDPTYRSRERLMNIEKLNVEPD